MALKSKSEQKQAATNGRPALLARITTLEHTVAQLETRLQKYEHTHAKGAARQSFWRSAGVWLLIALCSLSLLLSAATFWVQRTMLTTDVWVQKTSALLAQPEVRDTVSSRGS